MEGTQECSPLGRQYLADIEARKRKMRAQQIQQAYRIDRQRARRSLDFFWYPIVVCALLAGGIFGYIVRDFVR